MKTLGSHEEAKSEDEKVSTEKMKRYRTTVRLVTVGAFVTFWMLSFIYFPGVWGGYRPHWKNVTGATTGTVARPTTAELGARAILPNDAADLPMAIFNPDGTPANMPEWPKLRVPHHGDSKPVPHFAGYRVVWSMGNFKVHCVYHDGRAEGIIGDADRPCSDGPIAYSFARNETEGDDLVLASYAYAKNTEK